LIVSQARRKVGRLDAAHACLACSSAEMSTRSNRCTTLEQRLDTERRVAGIKPQTKHTLPDSFIRELDVMARLDAAIDRALKQLTTEDMLGLASKRVAPMAADRCRRGEQGPVRRGELHRVEASKRLARLLAPI
jgi:hypothetical protein